MYTILENFDIRYDDTLDSSKPFIVACRDREATSEERWVLASLSNNEAKKYISICKST